MPVHELSVPDERKKPGHLQFFAQLMGGYEYKNSALITAHVSASVNFFSHYIPSEYTNILLFFHADHNTTVYYNYSSATKYCESRYEIIVTHYERH